jgi:hypothetical protein
MAYTLNAVIADLELLRAVPDLAVVSLPQGKGLVPLTGKFWDEHQAQPLIRQWEGREAPDDDFDSADERRVYIDRATASFAWLADLCARLSAAPGAVVAYVEADFFGGAGRQAAAVWAAGELVFAPVVDAAAINRALARIGVTRAGGADEFAALGLDRCRMTERWLTLASGG